MTDATVPETPNETARRLWDTAIEHLEAAIVETGVPVSNAYCAIGELALRAAQFALSNPGVVAGVPENYGLPAGAPPLPPHMQAVIPGGPPLPVWGAQKP